MNERGGQNMISSPPPPTPDPLPVRETTFVAKLRIGVATAIGFGMPVGLEQFIYWQMPPHTNLNFISMALVSLPVWAIVAAVVVALGRALPKCPERDVAVAAACLGALFLSYTIVDAMNCTLGPRPRDAQVHWVKYEPAPGGGASWIEVTAPNDPADTWRFRSFWVEPEIATRIVRGTVVTVRYAEGWLGFRWIADVSYDLRAIEAQRPPVHWRPYDSE